MYNKKHTSFFSCFSVFRMYSSRVTCFLPVFWFILWDKYLFSTLENRPKNEKTNAMFLTAPSTKHYVWQSSVPRAVPTTKHNSCSFASAAFWQVLIQSKYTLPKFRNTTKQESFNLHLLAGTKILPSSFHLFFAIFWKHFVLFFWRFYEFFSRKRTDPRDHWDNVEHKLRMPRTKPGLVPASHLPKYPIWTELQKIDSSQKTTPLRQAKTTRPPTSSQAHHLLREESII